MSYLCITNQVWLATGEKMNRNQVWLVFPSKRLHFKSQKVKRINSVIVANECAENLFGDQLHSWQPNAGNTQMRELSIIGKTRFSFFCEFHSGPWAYIFYSCCHNWLINQSINYLLDITGSIFLIDWFCRNGSSSPHLNDWEYMTIEKMWHLKRCDDWEFMTIEMIIEMMGHCYDNDMTIDMTYGMTIYIFFTAVMAHQ